jgi:hypothetical protein
MKRKEYGFYYAFKALFTDSGKEHRTRTVALCSPPRYKTFVIINHHAWKVMPNSLSLIRLASIQDLERRVRSNHQKAQYLSPMASYFYFILFLNDGKPKK